MNDIERFEERLEGLHRLMRSKLRVRGSSFPAALDRAQRRLPKHVRNQARRLAEAVPVTAHPKLRATLDLKALDRAATDVEAYLQTIDLADQRKGYILGVLGSIAFNMLLIIAALIAYLLLRSPS